ncbi:MAG: hypothetical protein AAFU54_18105 [Chloroflexota bacterium]
MKLILLSNLAATLIMVGVIWFVQVVHYPLYSRINPDAFPNYEVAHVNLVTLVVGPAMFIEAGTALLLLVSPPDNVPLWVLILGLVLVGVVWAVTVFVNVPQHNQLSFQFDAGVHRALVLSNWIRTIAWSARGILMLWVLSRVMV